MLTPRPVTLKARNRKPPELGPKVRIEAARLSQPGDGAALLPIINGAGLRDTDKDRLKEHDTAVKNMWCGACPANLSIEFELPESVALGGVPNAIRPTKYKISTAIAAPSSNGLPVPPLPA